MSAPTPAEVCRYFFLQFDTTNRKWAEISSRLHFNSIYFIIQKLQKLLNNEINTVCLYFLGHKWSTSYKQLRKHNWGKDFFKREFLIIMEKK